MSAIHKELMHKAVMFLKILTAKLTHFIQISKTSKELLNGYTLKLNLTLADWAKRSDPDGRVPIVAELLSQTNEILDDCVFKEGNLPTGERVIIRTGLPSVYFRALNQGIPGSKSTTAQVDEACAILEARSEVDKDLAMLNGNTAQFRLSEDTAFLEAMNQTQAETMFLR